MMKTFKDLRSATCPVCFLQHKTRQDKMVDHGYGMKDFKSASCPGVGKICWEKSPQGTIDYLQKQTAELERLQVMVKDGKGNVQTRRLIDRIKNEVAKLSQKLATR